jgi:hypothetical protein
LILLVGAEGLDGIHSAARRQQNAATFKQGQHFRAGIVLGAGRR